MHCSICTFPNKPWWETKIVHLCLNLSLCNLLLIKFPLACQKEALRFNLILLFPQILWEPALSDYSLRILRASSAATLLQLSLFILSCLIFILPLLIYCNSCTLPLRWQKQHLLNKAFVHSLSPLSHSPEPPVEELGLPQIVPTTEDEVGPRVECRAHPAQAAVTAGTLQTVLVPIPVQGLQHEAISNPPVAAGAAPRLLSGLEGHERHTWPQSSPRRTTETDTHTHNWCQDYLNN